MKPPQTAPQHHLAKVDLGRGGPSRAWRARIPPRGLPPPPLTRIPGSPAGTESGCGVCLPGATRPWLAGWGLDPSLTGALTAGSLGLTHIGRTQGPETGEALAGASPGAQRGEGPPDLGRSWMDWQAGRPGGGGWTGRARCWGERLCLHRPASSGRGHGVRVMDRIKVLVTVSP